MVTITVKSNVRLAYKITQEMNAQSKESRLLMWDKCQ